MRRLPFLLAVLVGPACVTAEIPPVQGPAAAVKIGKADPTPDMQEIGPIEARNGSGCGAFGELGSYEGALAVLRNNAATMGADYVQIFTMREPYSDGRCRHNDFTIRGIAFRSAKVPAPADGSPAAANDAPAAAPGAPPVAAPDAPAAAPDAPPAAKGGAKPPSRATSSSGAWN
jgi:hypothetical protein